MSLARRFTPHAAFFGASACIMMLELVAGRLIARYLGNSLYTWTSVIGVVLAGMGVGNVLGGYLADRRSPHVALRWLLLAAAAVCLLALGTNHLFAEYRPFKGLEWPVQILVCVALTFGPAAIALGSVFPVAAKLALAYSTRTGATLGYFYAWGVAGSLLGTFLTGFLLVQLLGSRGVMLAVVAILALLGLALLWIMPADLAAREDPPASKAVPSARPTFQTDGYLRPGLWAWKYTPYLIAFLAALSMMTVEMLAGRLLYRQAGNSLYTWTSVIGAVLAGVSVGNCWGGWLADGRRPHDYLGWLFLGASVTCLVALFLNYCYLDHNPFKDRFYWPVMVFLTTFSQFFLPSLFLGTFGLVAARMALCQAPSVGVTLGWVSAWGTAGSIAGTLATGFWLISACGAKGLLMGVTFLLAVAALVCGPRRVVHLLWVLAMAGGLFLAGGGTGEVQYPCRLVFQESSRDVVATDSRYQFVRVYEQKSTAGPARNVRVLMLDNLYHGYVDLNDPGHLEYDYERIYRDVTCRLHAGRPQVSAFFIGGGSYTFPRWLLNRWPGSNVVVAEIDPLVVRVSHEALGLPADTPIRSFVMDARNALDSLPQAERFDFVFGDAFNDFSIPFHLTTVEFARKVKGRLSPGGAYIVNVIDEYGSGRMLGSLASTLRQVFTHVQVFCTERDGVKAIRDTYVIAGSDAGFDATMWRPGHKTPFIGSALTEENLKELDRRCGGRVLTDDDAPVENLMAPVMRTRDDE